MYKVYFRVFTESSKIIFSWEIIQISLNIIFFIFLFSINFMKIVSWSEGCWLTAEQTDFVFTKMNLYIYFPAVFKDVWAVKVLWDVDNIKKIKNTRFV